MNPSDLFNWALAIGLAWAVLVFFVPIEKWIGKLICKPFISDLEKRVAALEERLNKQGNQVDYKPAENSGS